MPLLPFSASDIIRQRKGRIISCSPRPSFNTIGYTDYQNYVSAETSFFSQDELALCSSKPQIWPRNYLYSASFGKSYFVASDYATIYNFPPIPNISKSIAVISMGGGLFGSYNPTTHILTGGDVQRYWTTNCGISPATCPTVLVYPLPGASNSPTTSKSNAFASSATYENTIDVTTLGACYPSSSLTIIMIIAPPTNVGLYAAFSAAINGLNIRGQLVQPTAIACSWGNPENTAFWAPNTLQKFDSLFATAVSKGITICVASGDLNASDGEPGKNVDFPCSSPHVISCGGTHLVCPNRVYDISTVETAWSNGGGGFSSVFAMPTWQTALKSSQTVLNSSNKRAVPDIAMNADTATYVAYLVNGSLYGFGGTSIVAPAMAALVGRMNKPNFSVASLYTMPTAFHDIILGNNGYPAGKGYDCCTGLGSPKVCV